MRANLARKKPAVTASRDAVVESDTVSVSKYEPAEDEEVDPSTSLRGKPNCVRDRGKLLGAVENQDDESGDEAESCKRVEFLQSLDAYLDNTGAQVECGCRLSMRRIGSAQSRVGSRRPSTGCPSSARADG